MSFETRINGMGHDGRGVARVDGKTTFVFGALKDEIALVELVKEHRRYDEAKAVAILAPSPERVLPFCPHFGACGGCKLQHLKASSQLVLKEEILGQKLKHFGQVSAKHWLPPLKAFDQGYRRRAKFFVSNNILGFRALYEPAKHCPIDSCGILDPRLQALIGPLASLIKKFSPDNLFQIEAAAGDDRLAFVLHHQRDFTPQELLQMAQWSQNHEVLMLMKRAGIKEALMLLSEGRLSKEEVLLKYQASADVEMLFSPADFTQVNASINRLMIEQAISLLALKPTDQVLDLYCGIGNFSLPIAKHCHSVVGVEGMASSVERARANALHNHIKNAQFFAADLKQEQALWRTKPFKDCNKLLLDPPRAGAKSLLENLNYQALEQLVYISCDASTLARDASLLSKQGFILKDIGIMDMFPHTDHIEVMANFKRQ